MPGGLAAAAAGGYQERLANLSNPLIFYDWGNNTCYAGTGTSFSNLGSGGTTYDGDLTNGTTYSSDFGGIMTLDGTDDRITIDTGYSVPRAGATVMIWCRTHQDANRGLFGNGSVLNFAEFGGTNGASRAETASNCNNFNAGGGANTKGSYTNEWYCAFFVWNSNISTWFEMGINQDSTTNYGNTNCAPPNVSQLIANVDFQHIGRNSGYAGHFDGDIGVVAAWGSALSDHQALQAFGAFRHRYGV